MRPLQIGAAVRQTAGLAAAGAADQAMRRYLARGLLAFTVTKSMFELLCRWADDPASSLHRTYSGKSSRRVEGSF